ncbi:MAG: AraC family transcriptional regulator [Bacteroidota bacterium]
MLLPPTFLQQVDQLIAEHLAAPDLLGIINAHFELSSSQVYRKIKQQTGYPPSIYIRQKRLEQARTWIVASDLPLYEIARRVGFQQLPYFSRCFSEHFGFAPSTLR